jgi:hypothetical protein
LINAPSRGNSLIKEFHFSAVFKSSSVIDLLIHSSSGHGQILIPAGKSAQPDVATVAFDATAKLPVGKEADQLREDGSALVHEPLSAVPGTQTSRSNIQIAASSKQTQLDSTHYQPATYCRRTLL